MFNFFVCAHYYSQLVILWETTCILLLCHLFGCIFIISSLYVCYFIFHWLDFTSYFDVHLILKCRNHSKDIRSVAFHKSYPLFASCSDDGTTSVFHGMVYSDLLQNPLLVPLKILVGHKSVNHKGMSSVELSRSSLNFHGRI